MSKVRGGGLEELPRIRGQWQPGGDTPIQGQGWPGEATSHPKKGVVTLRSHPEPEARGSSWEEPPTPKARAGGPEEQPEEWWLPSTGGPRGAIPR